MTPEEFTARFVPDDPLMAGAWVSCLLWAVGEEKIMDAFRADTGVNWTPGRTAIERMIDKACGVDEGFLVIFAQWFNANIWGDPHEFDDAPLERKGDFHAP